MRLDVLRDAVVAPTPAEPDYVTFTDATCGAIVGLLLTEAHDRGELLDVRPSFTDDEDSTRHVWRKLVTVRFAVGTDLVSVVREMVGRGLLRGVAVDEDGLHLFGWLGW